MNKHLDAKHISSYIRGMNKLSLEKRVQILSMLCEGSSMRSISRVCDVSINTVTKLLIDAGRACAAYHGEHVRDLNTERVQCDEIWSFTYAKAKNVPTAKAAPDGAGGDGTAGLTSLAPAEALHLRLSEPDAVEPPAAARGGPEGLQTPYFAPPSRRNRATGPSAPSEASLRQNSAQDTAIRKTQPIAAATQGTTSVSTHPKPKTDIPR